MNDMLLAGIAVFVTVLVLGGGAWISKVISGTKNNKDKTS
mgnify:CR=1 FL=1